MNTQLMTGIVILLGSSLAWAQNDSCASATAIAGAGSFPFSTVGATDSGMVGSCNAPFGGGSADGWFAWTSGSDTNYRFSICTTDYDAVVGIWDGCGGNELGCEDAVGCSASFLGVEEDVFGLTPNTTYWIQVDGRNGATGTGTLDIIGFNAPANDACASALPIAGTGSFSYTTIGATDSGAISSCNDPGANASADVWFSWTTGSATDYKLSICTTFYNSVISLRDACGGVELGCESSAGCGPSVLDVELPMCGLSPNTTYLIQIDGWAAESGNGTLDIVALPGIANDDCANATPIAGVGSFPWDNRDACPAPDGSASSLCDDNGTDQINSDIWYLWTAPSTGTYSVETCGTTLFDTVLAVYANEACPPTTPLDCSDDACLKQSSVFFDAVSGADYLLRVGSRGTFAQGMGDLVIAESAPTPIGTPFCVDAALPNSSGNIARLTATGSLSVADQSLAPSSTGQPLNGIGIFYYGTTQILFPFGDGVRCVGGVLQRLPFSFTDSGGTMVQDDVYANNLNVLPITASTFNFQSWFRDPTAMMTGFNFSDATSITFVP